VSKFEGRPGVYAFLLEGKKEVNNKDWSVVKVGKSFTCLKSRILEEGYQATNKPKKLLILKEYDDGEEGEMENRLKVYMKEHYKSFGKRVREYFLVDPSEDFDNLGSILLKLIEDGLARRCLINPTSNVLP